MAKFKVGDRVRVRSDLKDGKRYGNASFVFEMGRMRGKVVTIERVLSSGEYTIVGDKWCWTDEMLEPAAAAHPSIHITTDGKTTTAVLKEGGKVTNRAKAVCSPADTFDFRVGASIALERVFVGDVAREQKPIAKAGTTVATASADDSKGEWVGVYCVKDYEPGEWLTKGKYYAGKGDLVYDDGWEDDTVFKDFDSFISANPGYTKCLIPAYCCPAKAGDWIISFEDWILRFGAKTGTPYKMDDVKSFVSDTGHVIYHKFSKSNYVVLDGYEPPKKAEFKPYLCSKTTGATYGVVGTPTNQQDLARNTLLVGDTVDLYSEGRGHIGEFAVMSDDERPDGFIMSVKGSNFTSGRCDGFTIIKKRSHAEVADGEKVADIKYVKSEANR